MTYRERLLGKVSGSDLPTGSKLQTMGLIRGLSEQDAQAVLNALPAFGAISGALLLSVLAKLGFKGALGGALGGSALGRFARNRLLRDERGPLDYYGRPVF